MKGHCPIHSSQLGCASCLQLLKLNNRKVKEEEWRARAGFDWKEQNESQVLMQRENAKISTLDSVFPGTYFWFLHSLYHCSVWQGVPVKRIQFYILSTPACLPPSGTSGSSYLHTLSQQRWACLDHTEIAIIFNLVPSTYVIKKGYFVALTQHM